MIWHQIAKVAARSDAGYSICRTGRGDSIRYSAFAPRQKRPEHATDVVIIDTFESKRDAIDACNKHHEGQQ